MEYKPEIGQRLMDRINEEDARSAGITRVFYWTKILEGIQDEDKRTALGYLKEYSRNVGMEPPQRHEVGMDLAGAFRQLGASLIRNKAKAESEDKEK